MSFIIGFNRVKTFYRLNETPRSGFTIVIPFRNEAENLPELLNSLCKVKYDSAFFEVILVNDDSSDNGVEIVNSYKNRLPITLISNKIKSNSPKKDAIEQAIKLSKFDWIITTDADCVVPKNWLLNFNAFIQNNNASMICAPVTYIVNNSLLQYFQLLDFNSLMATTIGAFGIKKPILCNGANLCYNKKVFNQVNGFNGNNDIASGDDIFLLEKFITLNPKSVHFLKTIDSTVITKPEDSLSGLIRQRLRWTSKTTKTKNKFTLLVSSIVFLMNSSLIISSIYGFLNLIYWQILLSFFSLKFLIDGVLIYKSLLLFRQTSHFSIYPLTAIIYPFYAVIIVLSSIFKSQNTWKQREITP